MIARNACAAMVLAGVLLAPMETMAESREKSLPDVNRSTIQKTLPSVQPSTSQENDAISALEGRVQQLERRIEELESAVPALASGQSEIRVENDEIVIRAKRVRILTDDELSIQSGKKASIQAQQDVRIQGNAEARLLTDGRLRIESAATMDIKAPLLKLNNGTKPVLRADVPPAPSPTVMVP